MARFSGIPDNYVILPHLVHLSIPGFAAVESPGARVLAPVEISTADWFRSFCDRVVLAADAGIALPVCRVSDGEYRFLFGEQPPSRRHHILAYAKAWVWYVRSLVRQRLLGFGGVARFGIPAGRYSHSEVAKLRPGFEDGLEHILRTGILAAHLTIGTKPFQEHFHPALQHWLENRNICLTFGNYAPFYFVYAMLSGPRRGDILEGRRIGVLNSAVGDKRDRIISALHAAGAKEVLWHGVSPDQSAKVPIPAQPFDRAVDLVLVGAGVGKLILFQQLAKLPCPVVDAGFMFEVWADPAKAGSRPYCLPDRPS